MKRSAETLKRKQTDSSSAPEKKAKVTPETSHVISLERQLQAVQHELKSTLKEIAAKEAQIDSLTRKLQPRCLLPEATLSRVHFLWVHLSTDLWRALSKGVVRELCTYLEDALLVTFWNNSLIVRNPRQGAWTSRMSFEDFNLNVNSASIAVLDSSRVLVSGVHFRGYDVLSYGDTYLVTLLEVGYRMEKLPATKILRVSAGVLLHEAVVYVFGGFAYADDHRVNDTYLKSCEAMEVATLRNWSTVESEMQEGKTSVTVAAHRDRAYVCGMHEHEEVGSLESFCFSTKTFRMELLNVITPSKCMLSFVLGDELILISTGFARRVNLLNPIKSLPAEDHKDLEVSTSSAPVFGHFIYFGPTERLHEVDYSRWPLQLGRVVMEDESDE